MKLCRFNTDRLGVVFADQIADVSEALDVLPDYRWVPPQGDPVILHLEEILYRIKLLLPKAPRHPIHHLTLFSPVAAPTKIIGAPVNYHAHLHEAEQDHQINRGNVVHKIDEIGCFLKACSALTGPESVVRIPFPEERVDHEGEIAVIIGKAASKVTAGQAMEFIAGYSLALDMTVRGTQHRSMRKSCDGFAVLGPWLVTADDIADPTCIAFELTVNGEVRQRADTSLLIRNIAQLIEMCSAFYTLLPGDVIMTGTPAGVGPVVPGDRIEVSSPTLGSLGITMA
ncbi:MAG: fumarylacetoacetate hydrolase family protein [Burkholderiaceae bacterium]